MNKTDVKGYLLQLFDPSGGHWVAQAFGVAIAALTSFLFPIKGFLFLIGGLVVADLYTGWRKSRKATGAKINSRGVGRTIDKSLLYLVAMLVSRGIDKQFDMDGLVSVSYALGGLIVGREALSIFENIDAVLGSDLTSKITALFDLFKKAKKDAPDNPPSGNP